MSTIKQLVDSDAYAVDPRAVADAILRRLLSGAGQPSTRERGNGAGSSSE